jgi:eukaryotic-like serine/threonine-protein kinase
MRRELEILGARHSVAPEAVDLYLEAQRRSASTLLPDDSLSEVLDLLERAIEIAPDFTLAIAAHADFSVRRWFLPAGQNDTAVARRAHESVARASAQAAQVPLTHYAAGRLAVSDGRFGDAARELTLALALAPTYAEVHVYLGSLQCEAGRGDEGERHIHLAARLDPSLSVGLMLGRRFALNRDLAGFREVFEKVRAKPTESRFVIESVEMRVASWFGDLETVRRCHPHNYVTPGHAVTRFFELQRGALLGEVSEAELLAGVETALASGSGPRLEAFQRQLAVEALAPMGAIESAMTQLRALTATPAFVDADWMERCPALDPLRARDDFAGLMATVRMRADAIWRMASST